MEEIKEEDEHNTDQAAKRRYSKGEMSGYRRGGGWVSKGWVGIEGEMSFEIEGEMGFEGEMAEGYMENGIWQRVIGGRRG